MALLEPLQRAAAAEVRRCASKGSYAIVNPATEEKLADVARALARLAQRLQVSGFVVPSASMWSTSGQRATVRCSRKSLGLI